MRKIYAIIDTVAKDLAGQFPLVCFRTDEQAIRYFGDSLAASPEKLQPHAADFNLLYLGKVDDEGALIPHEKPSVVITGAALIAAVDRQIPDNEHQLSLLKEAR